MKSARISDHVDGRRLWHDRMELADFGANERAGVNRPARSKEEIDARAAPD